MNVALLLEMAVEGAPDRVLVGSRRGGLTALDLLTRSRRLAHYLLDTGAERVGLVDVNSEAVPLTLFGAAMAGVPYAPVNYRLSDDQLAALLRRLAPGVVVVEEEVIPRIGHIEGLRMITRPELFREVAVDRDVAGDLPFVDPDEVAVMLFTSGTTGEPKAALLRHRHLTSYIISTVEFLGAGPDEAQLVSVPPYHIAGTTAVLSSLYGGRRIVYLPGFEPGEWVRTVRDEGITQAMVVPTMLGRILASAEDSSADLSSLHHLAYGGGRMPVDVIERAMKVLPHVDYVNAYGLTETSSTIAVLSPEDHREAAASDDPAVRRRLGSVGRPLPTIELEVRDPDGSPLGMGERGEIYVRGEQVAGEYQGRSVLTADGWFPTNDAGWLDEGGYLFIEGRLDDVIVRGAENLSPGEIEDALVSHPAVAEAVVVGIPSEEWGETVGAAVVLEPGASATEEELKQWVRQRLRSARTPEIVQFRVEMPYSETGKLLRRVIRGELSQGA
jgi:acyl-CoA synthetase (AMP-forming)/AMP-acid ligase II